MHGYDFANGDKDPSPFLDDTHGTHVAGTVAAAMNGTGTVGMNPNGRVMGLKIGEGGSMTTDRAIAAISFAKWNGAKIINASWGAYFTVPLSNVDKALHDSIKDFTDAGGIFVAAAGNSTKNHDAG